jgi:hypothetical protein
MYVYVYVCTHVCVCVCVFVCVCVCVCVCVVDIHDAKVCRQPLVISPKLPPSVFANPKLNPTLTLN